MIWLYEPQEIYELRMGRWGFNTARGGIDPGDNYFPFLSCMACMEGFLT